MSFCQSAQAKSFPDGSLLDRRRLSAEFSLRGHPTRILSSRERAFAQLRRGRPDLWRLDDGHCLPRRPFRGGRDQQSPQADLCRGQASTSADCLSRNSGGRRDLSQIFFMIFSFPGRRGLVLIIHKLRRFLEKRIHRWRRIQNKGDTIPNSGEFGSCPRIRRPSANPRPGEIT